MQVEVRWGPTTDVLLTQPIMAPSQHSTWSQARLTVVWRIDNWQNAPASYNSALSSSLFDRQGVIWSLFFGHSGCVPGPMGTLVAGVQLHYLPDKMRTQALRRVSLNVKLAERAGVPLLQGHSQRHVVSNSEVPTDKLFKDSLPNSPLKGYTS